MSAIVYLSPRSRVGQYLGLNGEQAMTVQMTSDNLGVLVGVGTVEGAEEGTRIVKANKRVVIKPAIPICIKKYNAVIDLNPELAAAGIAQCRSILTTGEGADLAVYFDARKQIDLGSLSYLFRIFVID